MNSTMTHYMELLATAQPWHLILFMAIPVICAETLAISSQVISPAGCPSKSQHTAASRGCMLAFY